MPLSTDSVDEDISFGAVPFEHSFEVHLFIGSFVCLFKHILLPRYLMNVTILIKRKGNNH